MQEPSRFNDRTQRHVQSRLFYGEAAQDWLEALPLGNGHTAAMVWGGIHTERLDLNHADFWSGYPRNYSPAGGTECLAAIRKALAEADYIKADALSAGLMGPYSQSFLPLAQLQIDFEYENGDWGQDYSRSLDLNQALWQCSFAHGKRRYKRDCFISAPDELLVMRLCCDTPGGLNFKLYLTSPVQGRSLTEGNKLYFAGFAPENLLPVYAKGSGDYQDEFVSEEAGLAQRVAQICQVVCKDGRVFCEGEQIRVSGSSECLIKIAVGTSRQRPEEAEELRYYRDNPEEQRAEWNRKRKLELKGFLEAKLKKVEDEDFDALFATHYDDYRNFYERAALELPTDSASQLELAFNYGRYLLISSSRAGGQATNLQGLWNCEFRPPWSSNYTTNINTEMNYWPAEPCNLPELHEPLLQMTKEVAEAGREVAQKLYGMRGWVLHHNSDLWRQAWPVGNAGHGQANWAIWPMAGLWLCHHLWEHYDFNRDKTYLEHFALPIMASALEFIMDWIYEDPKLGLCSGPSSSPEQRFYDRGQLVGLAARSSMDGQLIRELAGHFIQACSELPDTLTLDSRMTALLSGAKTVLAHMPLAGIDSQGALLEWEKDFVLEEPCHRHLSHLYAVYPGSDYRPGLNPDRYKAARQALEKRGDRASGWGMGWRACLWARFFEAERALAVLDAMLQPISEVKSTKNAGGSYPNLFSAHPPFQIDGNFALSAAIVEMLLQSHQDYVELLPALPASWASSGSFRGLKARGNLSVTCRWENARTEEAAITAQSDCTLRIYLEDVNELIFAKNGQEVLPKLPPDKAQGRNGWVYSFALLAADRLTLLRHKKPFSAKLKPNG